MEGILADYDDSGSVWSELDGIFCMLIRTDNTTDAVNEIRDNLTENYAEDEHIYEDDMSHDYDTINDYISATKRSDADWPEEIDEHDPSNWDDSEEEDNEPDWDDEGDNY